ncbi:class II glutamine amidotransferase [Agaricicola taiwanensis]|uniref:class II glutamine amidotransferase n=1 Tax=Agaricicola taiwanensis TaxID=591372 RepID=UPI001E57F18E|nr:class II glutamine amidotransferase [Agaricicola taiwanensis]
MLLSSVITEPSHSLIHQSLHALEAKTETNGDGFGVGWYGEHHEPGLYKELRPAWGDENLSHLARQIRSKLFFAHIRAATGTATSRANCHPFSHGRFMFMHNGQIGGWSRLRRSIEAMIPDELYNDRQGTTDSEAIFLAALAQHAAKDPAGAMGRVLSEIVRLMQAAGITQALRFAAVMADGRDIWAFRWSTDLKSPTLYWKQIDGALIVVSEPLDESPGNWRMVPEGNMLMALGDSAPVIKPFMVEMPRAVA